MVNFFVEDTDAGNEPPHSLSANLKIKLAYCVGLISRPEYDDLTIINKIRNEFAHGLLEISFQDKSVQELCKQFKVSSLFREVVQHFPDDSRSTFVKVAILLDYFLADPARQAQNERCIVPDAPCLVGTSPNGTDPKDS